MLLYQGKNNASIINYNDNNDYNNSYYLLCSYYELGTVLNHLHNHILQLNCDIGVI